MTRIFRDIRYGLRSLVKHPGFTIVAVFTLALGIGVNTAILSTVNDFILRPISAPRPSELVVPTMGSKYESEVLDSVSYANYLDLRDQNKSLAGLLAWQMTSAGVSSSNSSEGSAEMAWGEIVSTNYFDVLEVKPILGRGFVSEEGEGQLAHPVVVLGHDLWRRRFNLDSTIVGKTIYMNGSPFTVIGVAPEEFEGVKFAFRQDFWVPLMMQSKFNGLEKGWEKDRGWNNVDLVGRLMPGVSLKQAEDDLNRVAANLAQAYPKTNADTKIQVKSQVDGRLGDIAGMMKFWSVLALGVSGLVLLVACANVANLMLARSASRAKEIGVRVAIGASRLHIIRQLLTESVLLALMGGLLGCAFAYWGTDFIRASIPPMPYPISLTFKPDLFVLKWMLLVSILTGFVFGLTPALLASRPNLVRILKGDPASEFSGRFRQRFNIRGLLVIAQVSISLVVLVCAGLFLRSLGKAFQTDPGFSVENLVTMRMDVGSLGYNAESGKRFYDELLKTLEAKPGVQSAALVNYLLLSDSSSGTNIIKEGEPDPLPNQHRTIDRSTISPGYFETMGTQLLLGRDFSVHDDDKAPKVAIVNQEFARQLYGSEQNALGKRVHFWSTALPLVEIVGVTKTGLYRSLYEAPRPYIFIPESQNYDSQMTLLLKVSSASDIGSVITAAREELRHKEPRLPVFSVQVGDQNMAFAYWGPRLAAGMAMAFGVLALLLATMGLYAVMTYSVTQRTREIGIRMALGAQVRDVLKLVVNHGLIMVLVGLLIGLGIALVVVRLFASLLLGVGTTDPTTFIGVSAVLLVVAFVACLIPARRATKVDPLRAIKYE